MSEANRCAECGSELAADAPQGLCPGCLLKRGLETNTFATGGEPSASADYVPPTPAELAAYFPDLEILELVGRGGMGVVYKARQKRLDRLVALKILSPKIGQDPAFAGRFEREARAMAMLSHPHIVTVHDFGSEKGDSPHLCEAPEGPFRQMGTVPFSAGGLYYFLMEFVDGVNLRRLLDTRKLSPEEALAIVPQICDALQYAHNAGVVHRDIKPENILLDKSGQVKIADFGLAKLIGRKVASEQEAGTNEGSEKLAAGHSPLTTNLTAVGQIMGTPNYMAPEQFEHPKDVDHRADIYSLGVVFYQMLTGELPIGRFAPPSRKVQIDVRLDEVVLRALEKEPGLRYQQVSEMKTRVETIATTPTGSGATRGEMQGNVEAGTFFGIPLDERRNGIPQIVSWPGLLKAFAICLVCGLAAALLSSPASRGYDVSTPIIVAILLSGIIVVGCAWIALKHLRIAGKSSAFPPSTTLPADDSAVEQARHEVRGPAIGLLVTGIFNWVVSVLLILIVIYLDAGYSPSIGGIQLKGMQPQGPTGGDFSAMIATVVLGILILSSLMIFAALKMKRLQAYGLAVAASILAIIISPSNLIGLPIGIWALVVLSQRDVRAAFAAEKAGAMPGDGQGRWLATTVKRLMGGIVLVLAAVWCFMSHDIASLTFKPPLSEGLFRPDKVVAMAIALGLLSLGIGILFMKKRNVVRVVSTLAVVWLALLCAAMFSQLAAMATATQHLDDLSAATDKPATNSSAGDNTAAAPPSPADSQAVFGPVIERVVEGGIVFSKAGINLETGKVTNVPPGGFAGDVAGYANWIRTNGIDATGMPGSPWCPGLRGHELVAWTVPKDAWEDMPAADVRGVVAPLAPGPTTESMIVGPNAVLPVTYLFKTRKGVAGVLQILEYVDKPRGLKIRYKLVRDSAAAKVDAATARLKLESAQSLLKIVDVRYKSGDANFEEFLKAALARDLAEAELKGDAIDAARANLRYTQQLFDFVEVRVKAGYRSTVADLEKAKLARDLAAAELKKLEGLNVTTTREFKKPIVRKPDRVRGLVLTYLADANSVKSGVELPELIEAIDRRINSGSEKVAIVSGRMSKPTDGVASWQIEVTLLRRNDTARQRVERLLLHPGALEFRILANTHDNKDLIERAKKEPTKAEVLDSSGKRAAWWAPVRAGEERLLASYSDIARRTRKQGDREIAEVLVVSDPHNVTGKYLTKAKASADNNGRPCLEFTFNSDGGKLFAKLTGEHLPDKESDFRYKLGIIIDGELQSAPAIQSTIHDNGQITGSFTKQDVSDMADILNAGSLPMRLRLVSP